MSDSSAIPASSSQDPEATVELVVKALSADDYQAIPKLFEGMSEPKRAAFRKEYLANYSLYGTVQTIEASFSEIRQDPMAIFRTSRRSFDGAILLDIAVGNRNEILYAVRRAALQFPDLIIPILNQRDTTKLLPALTKNLLSDIWESFPIWALLVNGNMIPLDWDDKTVTMICQSGFADGKITLPKLAIKDPKWNELAYRMCEVDNWLINSIPKGSRPALDFIDQLAKAGQLDRTRLLRSVLSGMHMVANQNQIRGCEMIFDFLAPTIDEVAECQADLGAILERGKPVSFTFVLAQLEKLADQSRIDWPLVCASLGSAISRAGIAQANTAIKLLQRSLGSPESLDLGCSALTQALLHNKREIAEAAWKAMLPVLPQANEDVLQSLDQARPLVQGTLGKTISDFLAKREPSTSNPSTNDASLSSALQAVSPSSDSNWDEVVSQLQSIPLSVRKILACKEACEASARAQLPASVDWGLSHSFVLSTCQKLTSISSFDELVLRIGRVAHSHANDPDEFDLILDALCRFPRSSDPQFASKTAAIKKDALSGESYGLCNQYAFPDFAFLILSWLGEPLPTNPDRHIRYAVDDLAHFVVAATIPWVGQGRSFSLTSTPTHRGGWIDPEIWLERLEALQASEASLLLEDMELALLRLAPDGRTTPIRNRSLIDRARKLEGAHALVVRYAMGDSIAWEDMTGSKRLWLAAIRGRDPKATISEGSQLASEIAEQQLLSPDQWNIEFKDDLGDFSRPKACAVGLQGRDLRNWKPSKTNSIQLGNPFETSKTPADNVFLTSFLTSRVIERDQTSRYRNFHPLQLDWYWASLLNNFILHSTKKNEIFTDEVNFPWLEAERPLTKVSAIALWLASLTKGDKSRFWLQEVWSQLVETDRLNIALLIESVREICKHEWCVLKRWAEVLAPVSARSHLHAWEMARLSLGVLTALDIDSKDANGFIEIIVQAYPTLGIALTADETAALEKYSVGKSKKAIQELVAVQDRETPERLSAAKQKLSIRIERARRWTNAVPAALAETAPLSAEESLTEQIDVASLAIAKSPSIPQAETSSPSHGEPAKPAEPSLPNAATSRKPPSGKKKEKLEKSIPLGRSHEALRAFRCSIPKLASLQLFRYYPGSEHAYLQSITEGFDWPESHYQSVLFHHLGIPTAKGPWEVAQRLQTFSAMRLSETGREWELTWLVALATSMATDNVTWTKNLADRLDLEAVSGTGEPSTAALAIAGMAISGLRSTPLTITNSLKLQVEKDKKLQHFLDTYNSIANNDSAAFVKCFESSAKKIASEIGKIIKDGTRLPTWWQSALLTVLWHAAKNAGLDCSKVSTQSMALVPTLVTLERDPNKQSLFRLPLAENHDQLALELLDRVLRSAGVRYALLRPRTDTQYEAAPSTEWSIVVDLQDESACNQLFESHNPEELLLNADLQLEASGDYQVALAAIPQHGVIFRRLQVPPALLSQILERAQQQEWSGASVCLATLEDAVGLHMPILKELSNDPRLRTGKAQNRSFYRRHLDDYRKWIEGLMAEAKGEIIWPKIQLVAKHFDAEDSVTTLKARYKV